MPSCPRSLKQRCAASGTERVSFPSLRPLACHYCLMDDPLDDFRDGTWLIVTFEVPPVLETMPAELQDAFPSPVYEVVPGESIAVFPDTDRDDLISIVSVDGILDIRGVDTYPGWDDPTKSAVKWLLNQMWDVTLTRVEELRRARALIRAAVHRRETEATIPQAGATSTMTVPIKLMTAVDTTALDEVSDDDISEVADATAATVDDELVPLLAGVRAGYYD